MLVKSARSLLFVAMIALPQALANTWLSAPIEPNGPDCDSCLNPASSYGEPGPAHVYFNTFLIPNDPPSWADAMYGPHVALGGQHASPGVAWRAVALLGPWRDCNGDGALGSLELGSFAYPIEDDTPVDCRGPPFLSDGIVHEFVAMGDVEGWRGYDHDRPVSVATPLGTTEVIRPVGAPVLDDHGSRVWADLSFPADHAFDPAEGTIILSGRAPSAEGIAPLPYGTTRSTGGLILTIDRLTAGRSGQTFRNSPAEAFLPWWSIACPGCGWSVDTQGTALHGLISNPEDQHGWVDIAWDCSEAGSAIPTNVDTNPHSEAATIEGQAEAIETGVPSNQGRCDPAPPGLPYSALESRDWGAVHKARPDFIFEFKIPQVPAFGDAVHVGQFPGGMWESIESFVFGRETADHLAMSGYATLTELPAWAPPYAALPQGTLDIGSYGSAACSIVHNAGVDGILGNHDDPSEPDEVTDWECNSGVWLHQRSLLDRAARYAQPTIGQSFSLVDLDIAFAGEK